MIKETVRFTVEFSDEWNKQNFGNMTIDEFNKYEEDIKQYIAEKMKKYVHENAKVSDFDLSLEKI